MIEIQPKKIKSAEVTLPGSKSFTHRMMITAALSNGPCILSHWLKSEDTLHTLEALKRFGIQIEPAEPDLHIHGQSGYLGPYAQPIYLGNSGTSMRLISALAALGNGVYHLTGNQRMLERPIQDLVDGLKQIGVSAKTRYSNGCPPLTVAGGKLTGGQIELNCEKSSQFLSAILLIAPYTVNGIDIFVTHGPVSRPYIDMTVEVMEKFGVEVKRDGYKRFEVNGNQHYLAGDFDVEPDASQASYFWAAAAITGSEIKVRGLTRHSKQGDMGFVELLERMGCHVSHETNGICVKGGTLSAIDVDMSNMPDVVPTLAVVAAFSNGTTHIRNVGHLKEKESDRLGAVVSELSKMGIEARCTDSDLIVKGGRPKGAIIDTYDDHRIAMSFSIAGLRIPGVAILDEKCVEKSFPKFWDVLEGLPSV